MYKKGFMKWEFENIIYSFIKANLSPKYKNPPPTHFLNHPQLQIWVNIVPPLLYERIEIQLVTHLCPHRRYFSSQYFNWINEIWGIFFLLFELFLSWLVFLLFGLFLSWISFLINQKGMNEWMWVKSRRWRIIPPCPLPNFLW